MGQNQTMYKKGELVRHRIVQTANNLFYHQGFNQTSFADIAEEMGTPKGNFYHYFKSKEDILDEVIEARKAQLLSMLRQIETQTDSPIDRIKLLLEGLLLNKAGYSRYGSPVGSLISELGKQQTTLKSGATTLLTIVHDWIARQFKSAGMPENNLQTHSRRLLSRLEGTILVAHAFDDAAFLQQEIEHMKEWIDDLIGGTTPIKQAG